jgi:polygalacturonase
MTLYLEAGATVLGGTDFAHWPLVPPLPSFPGDGQRYAPLLGGIGLANVRIVGGGAIDAQGMAWYAAGKALRGQRPHALEMNNVTGFELGGVSVLNSAFWSVHPVFCIGVHIHDVTIVNPVGNGDGIDPDGSANVLIERVAIDTADDAIAIKSGTAPPGGTFPPSRNITIRDSVLASGEACVAIGSEMTAGVEDVVVGPNVTCALAGHGVLYVKERQNSGGYVRNVTVANVSIGGAVARLLWLSQHFGEHGENAEGGGGGGSSSDGIQQQLLLPVLANVSISDVAVAPGGLLLEAALLNGARVGSLGGIEGLALAHVHLGAPLAGWSCANVSGTWTDVSPTPCAELTPTE